MFGHLSLHSLLYADDLVIIAETCDLLKDKLLVLQEWCETNKLQPTQECHHSFSSFRSTQSQEYDQTGKYDLSDN